MKKTLITLILVLVFFIMLASSLLYKIIINEDLTKAIEVIEVALGWHSDEGKGDANIDPSEFKIAGTDIYLSDIDKNNDETVFSTPDKEEEKSSKPDVQTVSTSELYENYEKCLNTEVIVDAYLYQAYELDGEYKTSISEQGGNYVLSLMNIHENLNQYVSHGIKVTGKLIQAGQDICLEVSDYEILDTTEDLTLAIE